MSELSYKAHLFVCLWYLSIITLVQRWRDKPKSLPVLLCWPFDW